MNKKEEHRAFIKFLNREFREQLNAAGNGGAGLGYLAKKDGDEIVMLFLHPSLLAPVTRVLDKIKAQVNIINSEASPN